MTNLIAQLNADFDYVIIDAPPVLAATDATVVGHGSSGVLLVAASARTTKPQLASAISMLDNAGSKLLGVVVTMLPLKGAGNYGYGYYGYGEKSKRESHSEQ